MESFLQSTSAHGLPHLVTDSRHRKAFWILVCLGSYIAMICATVMLYQKFHDPKNLMQRILAEEVYPKMKDGKMEFPEVYPRYVLCAQDPWSNLSRYEDINIMYIVKEGGSEQESGPEPPKMRKLPPLSLTYFEPMHEEDTDTFGMCCVLLIDSLSFAILWGKVFCFIFPCFQRKSLL